MDYIRLVRVWLPGLQEALLHILKLPPVHVVVAELHPGRRGRPKNLGTGEAHLRHFGDHLLRVPDILPEAVVVSGEVLPYPPFTAAWRVECEKQNYAYKMIRILP